MVGLASVAVPYRLCLAAEMSYIFAFPTDRWSVLFGRGDNGGVGRSGMCTVARGPKAASAVNGAV